MINNNQNNKQQTLSELYHKLGEAEIESQNNAKTISHDKLMEQMKEKLNE